MIYEAARIKNNGAFEAITGSGRLETAFLQMGSQ